MTSCCDVSEILQNFNKFIRAVTDVIVAIITWLLNICGVLREDDNMQLLVATNMYNYL